MRQQRSAEQVVCDHLELGKHGTVEDDLARNYAEDVVCFTREGLHHGHDGVRHLAERLRHELPNASFEYTVVLVDGDAAFLEWTGASAAAHVSDGADSFVVRDGKIVAQTIHYTVAPGDSSDDSAGSRIAGRRR